MPRPSLRARLPWNFCAQTHGGRCITSHHFAPLPPQSLATNIAIFVAKQAFAKPHHQHLVSTENPMGSGRRLPPIEAEILFR